MVFEKNVWLDKKILKINVVFKFGVLVVIRFSMN